MDEDQGTYTTTTSRVWYLLPLFMGVFGGLVVWACLRHRDRDKTFTSLLIGSMVTALSIGVQFIVVGM